MTVPRALAPLLAVALLLGAACSDDDSDAEATTGTDPTTDTTDSADPTEGSSTVPTDGPDLDPSDLAPLPGVIVTVTPEVRGGRVLVLTVEVANAGDDDVAVLPLDDARGGPDGDGYRVVNVRPETEDGDDAPPQRDALFVAAGASVAEEKTFGELTPLPTTVTVCLEGAVLTGGPGPTDDDPPMVRIGPRDDEVAGVACSDPTPVPEG